jgi:hypothetical protein
MIYLNPDALLFDSNNLLSRERIVEYTKYYKAIVRIHSFVADLPGKAAMLNTKQFNGYYGCLVCKHSGEYSGHYNKMIYRPKKV